jgi:hypothetical protein
MTGSSPYPPGFGAPLPGSGPPPPGGPVYGPQPASSVSPTRPARSGLIGLLASGLAFAALLGIAALILSIIGLTRSPESPPLATPKVAPQELFVDDADKPLCEAIGPLMREESDRTNAFLNKGGDTPERLEAIPQYKSATADWADRIQPVLNQHADPPRYLTRTLQQYIDAVLLYSENLYADRGPDPFDKSTYDSAVVALGGPLATCYKVGVRW